ncbi:MAG: sulfite exporter TauE/SafE family protein [Actinomycetota bacterium]
MDPGTAIGLVALGLFVGLYGTIIGAGGGFVMIPALVLLFDLQGATAVGTGAVALMVIGLTGAASYSRSGLVAWPVAAWFAVGAIPLALLSAWLLANRIDADAFIGILGVLLLALAVIVATGRHQHRAGGAELPARPDRLVPSGALVGLTSGTFAVGGGLVTVPILERVQRMVAHRATATTSATAWASSFAGSVGHTIAGNVEWDNAGVLAVAAMAGSAIGAKVAGRLAPGTVRALVAVGLVAAGVPLVVDALA